MMPLAFSQIGKPVVVTRVDADDKIKKHLENLGILRSAVIVPVSDHLGNLVVKVKESRLAINRGLAMKIFVE